MIILEIALGIVVAFFILAFLPVIFALLGKLITDVFFPIAGILALILLIWGVFKFFDMFFDSPDFRIGTAFVVLVLFVVGIVKSIGNGKIKLAKQDESIAYAEEVTQDWADFLLQELSAELLFYIKNNIIEASCTERTYEGTTVLRSPVITVTGKTSHDYGTILTISIINHPISPTKAKSLFCFKYGPLSSYSHSFTTPSIKQALKISKETIKDYVEKYPSVLSKVGIDENGRIEPKL
jgi:hypothetical protein|tara:strand:- start:109 stop:822 length:714 start_codon:yes stop_codon:yes gene_type:complete